jgi:hypothetical protein
MVPQVPQVQLVLPVLLVWTETDTIHTQLLLFRLTLHQVMAAVYHLWLTIHLHTYRVTQLSSWIQRMLRTILKVLLVLMTRPLVRLRFMTLQTLMVCLVHRLQSYIM